MATVLKRTASWHQNKLKNLSLIYLFLYLFV